MSNITINELKKLCNKYKLTTSGTKAELAQRLGHLRGEYLSKTERKKIIPLIKRLKTKQQLKLYNETNLRKIMKK